MKEEYSGESDLNNHFWNFIREESADNWKKIFSFILNDFWLAHEKWVSSFFSNKTEIEEGMIAKG
jgi:ABC-type siderophore export system fused ATPase/permease subunit